MKRKKLSSIGRGIFLAAVIAGALLMASYAPAAASEEPIKIGALFDFTGPAADLGPWFQEGMELALDEANHQAAGRPLKVIVEDSGTDSVVTLDKTKKLVETDKVNVIIGPLMCDAQLAMAPYTSQHKTIIMTLFNGPIELVPYGNFIIFPTTNGAQTMSLGFYAYDKLDYRTMIVIGSDDVDGHAFMGGFSFGFEERGGKVVQTIWVSSGTMDFGPYIASFKKDADFIGFFFPNPTEVVRLITQMRGFGVKPAILATTVEGDMPPPVLEELGEAILGVVGQDAYISTRDDPLNKKFVAKLEAKYGYAAGAIHQNGYVLTKVLLAALEATGGDTTFDKLWPAILDVKLQTPAGPLAFSPEGVAITTNYIAQAKIIGGRYLWEIIDVYPNVLDIRLK